MIRQVLTLLKDTPSRLTEIKKHFDLAPSMAANYVIWLEDAGFIEECPSTCGSCGNCGGCGNHGQCGGCGINAPYRLTESGLSYLNK